MKTRLCVFVPVLMLIFITACDRANESTRVSAPAMPQKTASPETLQLKPAPNTYAPSAIVPETVTSALEDAESKNAPDVQSGTPEKVDVDLTLLSNTMVYSEVYHMTVSPEKYIGKRVKMTGKFVSYQDKAKAKNYFSCLVADATACCAQGLDFVLKGERTFPDDYPAQNKTITVTGIFDVYTEDGYLYMQLIDAEME